MALGEVGSPKTIKPHYGFSVDVSRSQTLKQLRADVLEGLKTSKRAKTNTLSEDSFRLWNFEDSSHPVLLVDDDQTIKDLGLSDGHHILLEEQNEDLRSVT